MNSIPRPLSTKPYFFFRPGQAFRRLSQLRTGLPDGPTLANTAWGGRLVVDPHEMIGGAVLRTGVWELAVGELCARLAEPAETAVDVGANIGYFTLLLAACVGQSGKVIALEPHPALFAELRSNVTRAQAAGDTRTFQLLEAAASAKAGFAQLRVPLDFNLNRGVATVEAGVSHVTDRHTRVPTIALDEVLDGHDRVGVAKLDCEGHELEVLHGAQRALSTHQVRDIIFEEHAPVPSALTEHLAAVGYSVFAVEQRFLGVRVRDTATDRQAVSGFDAPNYLATTQPARALSKLTRPGWRSLRQIVGRK